MHLFNNLFHRIFKKKKLNLREVHHLYLILKDYLPDKEETYLINQINSMLEKMENGALLRSIEVAGKGKAKNKNTIELLILFVSKLKENDFFEYVKFVNGINGKPRV